MDWKAAFQNDPRFGGVYRSVARPSWPTRLGVLSGLLVVVLPLMLVVLTGLLVGVLVYAVGSLLMNLRNLFGGNASGSPRTNPEPGDEVRENVRIIPRA